MLLVLWDTEIKVHPFTPVVWLCVLLGFYAVPRTKAQPLIACAGSSSQKILPRIANTLINSSWKCKRRDDGNFGQETEGDI